MKKCGNGHEADSILMKFCGKDGMIFWDVADTVCMKCSFHRSEDDRFCTNCGFDFRDIILAPEKEMLDRPRRARHPLWQAPTGDRLGEFDWLTVIFLGLLGSCFIIVLVVYI